jgi:hypothetical protein
MKKSLAITFCGVFLGLLGNAAFAAERVLDDAAWRADIDTVARSIVEFHPRPFRDLSAEDFRQQHQRLIDDVPSLSDKAIIIRLAALVGLIKDGHTRLTIPREHPEIGLEFGHTPTLAPEHDELAFKQLPLAFEKFEDGVFVVAASSTAASLIGHKVSKIDDTPIEEALEMVQAVTFADNCVHCKTCDIKDPKQNIVWTVPEGGGDRIIPTCSPAFSPSPELRRQAPVVSSS